jgi:F-type H+-transporting ATPase subunit delta
MSVLRIAGRYAKSLIDLAEERGKLEEVHNDVLLFNEVAQNRDFALLLKSPIIHADKKQSIFNAIFGGKISDVTEAFFRILLTKGREAHLLEIGKEFIELYKHKKEITTVKLVTAKPISAEMVASITQRLELDKGLYNNIELETAVDPELIGGFTIEFNSKRFDASIAHKIDLLRKEFSTNVYTKDF